MLVAAFDFTTTYANHEKTERPNTVLGLLDLAGAPRRKCHTHLLRRGGEPLPTGVIALRRLGGCRAFCLCPLEQRPLCRRGDEAGNWPLVS
jgi:hypothetical protein